MIIDNNYYGHKFIKKYEFGISDYECAICKIIAVVRLNCIQYFIINYTYSLSEIFSYENVLTCEEMQIKKLLE